MYIITESQDEIIHCHCGRIFRRTRDLIRHQRRQHLSLHAETSATPEDSVMLSADHVETKLLPISCIISELSLPPALSPIHDSNSDDKHNITIARMRAIFTLKDKNTQSPLMQQARKQYEATAEKFGRLIAKRIPHDRVRKPRERKTIDQPLRRIPPSLEDLTLLVEAYPDSAMEEIVANTILPLRLDPIDLARVRAQIRCIKQKQATSST